LRLVQPITGADKVIRGGKIVRGVRDYGTPSILARTRFQRTHQAQLKSVSTVFFQYSNTAEIPCVASVRRGDDSGEGHRYGLAIRQPPVPPIEFRNGRAIKERQAVNICQRVRDFVVIPIDLANSIHLPPATSLSNNDHLRHRRAFSISLSEMPLDRAQDSTAASPYCATAFFTTQQGTTCAGMKAEGLQPRRQCGSFAEHDLDAEPHRSDNAGDDNGNDGLERIALCLFDALAPASQVMKVRSQFGD
jgi:hypothetical protein